MVTANLSSQMVPVEGSSNADEPKIIFIVKDETTNDWQNNRSVINLPESTTVEQLINEVAKHFHYCPSSFRLTWESMVGQEVDLSDGGHGEKTSSEMGFYHGRKNTISVKDKDGLQPRRMDGTMGEAFSFTFNAAGSSSSSPGSEEPVYGPLTQAQSGRRHAVDQGDTKQNSGVPLVADSSISPSHPTTDYSHSYGLSRSDTGYVGLVNQAMTCYLNSLLQTLFMTPEFRNAVYRWDYDGAMEEEILGKSIPFQLQRLFLALQTSKKRAIETTNITKSFGWDSSEAWQQHDIQELCRILFDALETKWRKTDQRDVINQLYQGKMKDYVKCLECGYESARMDAFLDVPLTVRPFGSSTSYSSVEESLEAFVAAETLDGNNQYFCEKCGKKCDARKGLKFEHFPYILTMQMKRFDFDYNTLQRIKLNERMTFPEILNLNRFTKDDESLWKSNRDHENEDGYPYGWTRPAPTPTTSNEQNEQSCLNSAPDVNSPSSSSVVTMEADSSTVNTESESKSASYSAPAAPPLPPGGLKIPGGGRRFKSKPNVETASPVGDEDEGIEIESSNSSSSPSSSSSVASASSCNAAHDSGPYVYELFSVMIHSGSANGGHYYAYIKSLAEKQWYSFNDQHVQKIAPDDVFKTFGGGNGGARSYYYQSSVNAYMLMYRQIRPENADPIAEQNFPPHIKNILKREQEREEEERKQREIDRCMCKIKLFCLKPSTNTQTEYRFEIHKDKTLKEATKEAFQLCGLEEEGIALEDVRLVKYDEYHETFERSYNEVESNDSMEKILQGVKSSYMFDLYLEIKPSYASFQTYKPGGTTVKVHLVDLDDQIVHPAVNVRAQLSNSVEEFKGLASRALNLKFVGDSSSLKADQALQTATCPSSSSAPTPSDPSNRLAEDVDNPAPDDVIEDDDAPPKLPRHILKSLHCVFERYTNDLRYLGNPCKSLKSEGFFRSNKVFITYKADDEGLQKLVKMTRPGEIEDAFKLTRLHSLLDTHNHIIRLTVTLPPEAPHPPTVGSLLLRCDGSKTVVGGGAVGGGVGIVAKSPSTTTATSLSTQRSAPSSVLSAAPSCESGYATSTSTALRNGAVSSDAATESGSYSTASAAVEKGAHGDCGDIDVDDNKDDDENNQNSCKMDTTESSSSGSFYHNRVDENHSSKHLHNHPPLVTSSSADNSSASTSSSSTKTLLPDEEVLRDMTKTTTKSVLITGRRDASASSMSPRSSIANSPDACTVSPMLDRSPVGLESPPAGVSVVGGGKGWSFPESEDPLDDCMLPESASGRVSPAGDPSEGEDDADNSPDNSQANAKLESWRTEMSRNWIRDVNSRQMMSMNDNDSGADGPVDKDNQIGTWSDKDLDAFAASTRQKFSSVENLAAPSDGTEIWTDSGNVSGTKDWQMTSGAASPEMMATSPPAASVAMSCDSAPPSDGVTKKCLPSGTTDEAEITSENHIASTSPSVSRGDHNDDCGRFFKAYPKKEKKEVSEDVIGNVLTIEVDKRITLGSFKKRLEPWLGTTADHFKVFRVYPNSQEFESTRLTETLTAFSDDGKMSVKYGRALRKGEYRVKVYHLDLEKPSDAPLLLCETVFANEMTVLEGKNQVMSELAQSSSSLQSSIGALPSSRVRLRKRAWKNPGTIYLEDKAFNADIPIFPNWEVILQVLKEPQPLLQANFVGVFLRRWRPSDFALDPFQEVFLYHSTLDELVSAISFVSGIPTEKVSVAKGRGNFPCDVNLFDIESELEWDPPNVTALNVWPLYICDDGCVIYYRDKDEKHKELNDEQRNALQQQQQHQSDSSRNGRSTTTVTFSPRKERPLRIKVYSESEDNPPVNISNKTSEKILEDDSCDNASPSSSKKTRSSPLPTSGCSADDID